MTIFNWTRFFIYLWHFSFSLLVPQSTQSRNNAETIM